jgi:hypothetical protein
MATIKTLAPGVSPYKTAAATAPTVLTTTVNGRPSTVAAATSVIVNGQAALNSLITTSQTGVFQGANVTINLDEQNFSTTNQVTSNTNYPSGNTGEIQFNSGSNSFASNAYFTYDNSNVITPGIRTDGYFYSNGSPFTGGGNAAIGNFIFTGDAMTIAHANSTLSVTGNGSGNINVSSNSKTWIFGASGNLTLPANTFAVNYANGNPVVISGAGANLPLANGTSNINIATANGNVTVTANAGNTWTFDTTGNLVFPANLVIDNESPNTRIFLNSGALKLKVGNAGTLKMGWDEFQSTAGNVAQIIVNGGSAGQPQNVVVFTGNESSTTYQWIFGKNGNLTLPANTFAVNYANGNPVVISGGAAGLPLANGTSNINIATANGNVTVTANAGNTWTFAAGGNLTFPTGLIIDNESPNTRIYQTSGSLKIRAVTTASLKIGWDEFSGASTSGSLAHVIANGGGSGEPANLVVLTGNSSTTTYQWIFNNQGDLTAPGNISAVNLVINSIRSDDSSFVTIEDGLNVTSGLISAPESMSLTAGANTWTFNANGNTVFPTLSVRRGDTTGGTITGQTLLFGDSTQEAIISTPDGNNDINNSQRLVINPGAGADNTAGEGGDIYLWAGRGGNASGSGGDIKIRGGQGGAIGGAGGYIRIEAGDGDTGTAPGGNPGYVEITGGGGGNTHPGGYVRITGGTGDTAGGDANLVSGYGSAGPGGNVNIIGGGSGLGLADYGNVNITAGSSTWTFDNTGVLTLPGEGIVRSNNDTIVLQSYDVANTTGYGLRVGTTGGLYLEQGSVPSWLTFEPNAGNAQIYSGIGTAGGAGKSLTINAGQADQTTYNTSAGGNLNLYGGLGASNDGGGGGPGGSVNISAGNSADPAGHHGNVKVNTGGANVWTFDYTGNLTVPGSIILPPGALITGTPASPAPRLNGFDSVSAVDLSASGNVTATRVSTTGNVTANYFIGNGSQLTSVAVPSQTILPTIQTITATARPAGLFGGGQGGANVTVANTIPVTEYGVIITAGTVSETYKTGALGSIPGTVSLTFSTGLNSTQYTLYAYVTSNAGTYYSDAVTGTSGICLLAGTQIALSDGTRKAIEDITYTDKLLSWDFDRGCYAETTALWIKRSETGSQYNLLTFSDGTTLRTFDQHRIFNKQAGAFTYPMTDATPIGTVTVNEHGQEITLTRKQVIQDTIEYYNVITDYHMNLFSDSVLTSCRFNNIYPIVDMKFTKDSRTLRTREEFENIEDRFFHGLRLAEQTADIETVEWYVNRLLSTEVSTQAELAV